jgi:hypothetical protein
MLVKKTTLFYSEPANWIVEFGIFAGGMWRKSMNLIVRGGGLVTFQVAMGPEWFGGNMANGKTFAAREYIGTYDLKYTIYQPDLFFGRS